MIKSILSLLLIVFHLCFVGLGRCTDDCNCAPNALCVSEAAECQCQENFYGDGSILCQECEDFKESPQGSTVADDCKCSGYSCYFKEGDCSMEETLTWVRSVLDMGVFSSYGCDATFKAFSRSCCDYLSHVLSHHCAEEAMSFLLTQGSYPPHMASIYESAEICGIDFYTGELVPRDDCGNGTADGWEHCDDGNSETGDGCSECWVDEGYSCEAGSGGVSVCRDCQDDCTLLHRSVCVEPGGPCGGCLDGFEDVGGTCGAIIQVYYTAMGGSQTDLANCTLKFLGTVIETDEYPHADRYIDLVRSVYPHRSPSDVGSICNINDLANFAPEGANAITLGEVFERSIMWYVDVGDDKRHVRMMLFSDSPTPAVLDSNRLRFSDVYTGCSLLLHNLVIIQSDYFEGSISRVWGGTLILESVTLRQATTKAPTDLEFHCGGYLLSLNGIAEIRDSVIEDNYFSDLEDRNCLSSYDAAIMISGYAKFENVTIRRNSVGGDLFRISAAGDVYFYNVTLDSNIARSGSIIQSEGRLVTSGLVAWNNTGRDGAFLSQKGMTSVSLNNFEIYDNIALDEAGIIYNAGFLHLLNGIISYNRPYNSDAVIVNRASLEISDSVISGNLGSVLDSTSSTTLLRCTLGDNIAARGDHLIRSIGTLYVSECDISGATEDSSVRSIESQDVFVVRDSRISDATALNIASCNTILPSSYLPYKHPCGVQATCLESELAGVTCECPHGYHGDPFFFCGRLAELYVLPETSLNDFPTKDDFSMHSSKVVQLLGEGLGLLDWVVHQPSLPAWLTVSPPAGTLRSDGVCPDDLLDLTLDIDLEHITADVSQQTVDVLIHTTTTFSTNGIDFRNTSTVHIHLFIDVEVIPSPSTSVVKFFDACSGSVECSVTAGSSILVAVDLRDAANYSVGAGGFSYEVDSTPLVVVLSETDFNNGSYALELEVPQTHFSVSVTLRGQHIQGSPLRFRVHCAGGDTWDDEENKCVSDLWIPKKMVAISLAIAFVVLSGVILLFQYRDDALSLGLLRMEPVKALFFILMDLVDIATDFSAWYSINSDEDLQSYASWYLGALTLAVITAVCSIGSRIHILKSTLAPRSPSVHGQSNKRLTRSFALAGVSGFEKLECEDDVRLALDKLRRQLRSQLLSIAVLILEDIPMQVLNAIMLSSTSGPAPVAVIVSMEVSCLQMGFKLTKVMAARRTAQHIKRVKQKVAKIAYQSSPTRSKIQ